MFALYIKAILGGQSPSLSFDDKALAHIFHFQKWCMIEGGT